jgi:hypothetical protein
MAHNTRDGTRIPLHGRVAGEVMVYQPMLLREISIRGALVETRFPLHLNSLHDLRLQLADRSLVLKGRVVHSQAEDTVDGVVYSTGVEFVEPSEHVALALVEFLEFAQASSGGV